MIAYLFKNKQADDIIQDGTLNEQRLKDAGPWSFSQHGSDVLVYQIEDISNVTSAPNLAQMDESPSYREDVLFYSPKELLDLSVYCKKRRNTVACHLPGVGKILNIKLAITTPKRVIFGWAPGEDSTASPEDEYGKLGFDVYEIFRNHEIIDETMKEEWQMINNLAFLAIQSNYRITPDLFYKYKWFNTDHMQALALTAIGSDEYLRPKE